MLLSFEELTPFQRALSAKRVEAKVISCDHYRVHGGLAVESDYIVAVQSTGGSTTGGGAAEAPSSTAPEQTAPYFFEPFCLSKNYSAFRTLAAQLEKVAEAHRLGKRTDQIHEGTVPADCIQLAKYCQLVTHLIHSQRTRYLGKVNYMYVKVLAKERSKILNTVLEATMHYFPAPQAIRDHDFVREVALIVLTFFLTDHCSNFSTDRAVAPLGTEDLTLSASSTTNTAATATTTTTANTLLGRGGKILDTAGKVIEKGAQELNPLQWLPLRKTGSDAKSPTASDNASDSNAPNRSIPPPLSLPQRIESTPSVVVPLSRRERRDDSIRDDMELAQMGNDACLMIDDDRPAVEFLPSYAHPKPVIQSTGNANQLGTMIDNNPLAFLLIAVMAIMILKRAAQLQVRLDGDVFLLVVFATFCLGLHTPRPMVGGFDRPPTMMGAVRQQQDRFGRQLLQRSIHQKVTRKQIKKHTTITPGIPVESTTAATGTTVTTTIIVPDDDVSSVGSMPTAVEPLRKFPDGAKIGSHLNCWSEPDPGDFEVRGPHYLTDKKKTSSGEYLFPCRGVDLLLTDTCPENVGQNPFIFGGRVREVPTFLVNFRLPWGVLIMYFEIPQRFIPFIKAGYETGDSTPNNKALPDISTMSPSERTVCRFLMNDQKHKNSTLKIIPFVVDGPWVVKSVVGGKPAIIGNKLPVQYHYGPASGDRELYLEADLDIAASSAARGILSVTRSYTQILTLNLGFVVQGNTPDELPEQMLVGLRLHGVDPLTAPPYPVQIHDGVVGAMLNADDPDEDSSLG